MFAEALISASTITPELIDATPAVVIAISPLTVLKVEPEK